MAGPRAVGVIPTLIVDDLGAAADFYAALGFQQEWSYPEEGTATHLGCRLGEVTIMLSMERDAEARTYRQNLYFLMRDLDGFHRRLERELPGDVPAIVDADYGMRDFSMTDPWGHLLTFGEG